MTPDELEQIKKRWAAVPNWMLWPEQKADVAALIEELEQVAGAPDSLGSLTLDHVTSVVSAECSEALLGAQLQTTAPVGRYMLNDVYRRLKHIAEGNPAHVARLPYEVLVGIAAQLTGECKIWWGEPFDLATAESES